MFFPRHFKGVAVPDSGFAYCWGFVFSISIAVVFWLFRRKMHVLFMSLL